MSPEINLSERTNVYFVLIQMEISSICTNFKMLPKTNHILETKCMAVFHGQLMALQIASLNPRILLGKSDYVFFMKVQITQNKIIFPKLFFANYARTRTRSSLQYFIWLKSKLVKIYSIVKSKKLLSFYVYFIMALFESNYSSYCSN